MHHIWRSIDSELQLVTSGLRSHGRPAAGARRGPGRAGGPGRGARAPPRAARAVLEPRVRGDPWEWLKVALSALGTTPRPRGEGLRQARDAGQDAPRMRKTWTRHPLVTVFTSNPLWESHKLIYDNFM